MKKDRSTSQELSMIRFSDLADINPPRSKIELGPEHSVSFIPMGDTTESGRWINRQSRNYNEVRQGFTSFKEGDVLFAKITPCMENGKGCHAIGLVNSVGFGSTEFHILRAREGADSGYIYQLSIYQELRRKAANSMTGSAGQQRVPKSFFDTFLIPEFSKFEQSKIAEVLSTVDRAIEQTEALIAKQQRIKTGLMQDLLTRGIDEHGKLRFEKTHEFKDSPLGRIPVEWEVVSISSVADVRGRVGWKGYTVDDLRDSGPLALGAAQITTDYQLDLSRSPHLSLEKYEESPDIMVSIGDVLVVQRGNSIGKVVLIDRDIGPATINPSMILLTKLKISPEFVYAALINGSFQKQLSDEMSATGVPMISQAQLRGMQIPKPDEKEQMEICKILAGLFDSIHTMESNLLKMRNLKTALMQDLLTGRKRVTSLLDNLEVLEI